MFVDRDSVLYEGQEHLRPGFVGLTLPRPIWARLTIDADSPLDGSVRRWLSDQCARRCRADEDSITCYLPPRLMRRVEALAPRYADGLKPKQFVRVVGDGLPWPGYLGRIVGRRALTPEVYRVRFDPPRPDGVASCVLRRDQVEVAIATPRVARSVNRALAGEVYGAFGTMQRERMVELSRTLVLVAEDRS